MATEYDSRRPRLPKPLGAAVDAARGQVPFNRFVVQALEKALDDQLKADVPLADGPSRVGSRVSAPSSSEPRSVAQPAPVRAPARAAAALGRQAALNKAKGL